MNDAELVSFLQWALPQRGFRWAGFRHVRSTVRKRLSARLTELSLPDLTAYRARLVADPAEWDAFDRMCRIPISRFHRDRMVFEVLAREILPARALDAAPTSRPVRVWSAGCASGEEPYTVAILWERVVPHDTSIEILATDAEEHMLERARRGCYPGGSLRELPENLRDAAFSRENHLFCVRDEYRPAVTFRREDLRAAMPDGPFDLILCRYLAFTYFGEDAQRATAQRLVDRLLPGGALVIGTHEALPAGLPVAECAPYVYRRER